MFIVQVNEYGIPVTDMGYHLIEACKYQNWYGKGNIHTVETKQLKGGYIKTILGPEYADKDGQFFTPVGTIEFVEKHLHKNFGIDRIKVLNIPQELNNARFTRRKIWKSSAFGIKQAILDGRYDKLFVKSATKCKKYTTIVDKFVSNGIPEDDYLVSEYIEIKAEWRVFVFRGEIVDVRLYMGEWTDTFDAQFIKEAVIKYKDCPPAYTLDVGLLDSGEMAIIEVHNFISCGLYGFENYKILPQMIKAAYKHEMNQGSDIINEQVSGKV